MYDLFVFWLSFQIHRFHHYHQPSPRQKNTVMKCGHPVMFATLIFSLLMMSSRVGATGYPVCDNADYGKRCQCPAGCYMVSGCDGGNPSVCKPCPEGYFQPIVGSQQSCENCSDKIPVLGACYTCKATEAPRVVPCTPTPGPPIPPTSHSSSAMPSASPSIGTSTFWTSSPTTNGSHVPSTSSSPPPMPVHDRRTVTPAVIAACCGELHVINLGVCRFCSYAGCQ